MNRLLSLPVAFALWGASLLPCRADDPQATGKPDTVKWEFTNETELRAVINKYKEDPRNTYNIILRASHHQLIGQATVIYHELVDRSHDDPRLQSAFAFSQWLATYPIVGDGMKTTAPQIVHQVHGWRAEAGFYRGEALKTGAEIPEILLECAIPMSYEGQWNTPDRVTASLLARKAVKLAPKWAEAHYWLAHLLEMRWIQKHDFNFGHEELAELEVAEKLQPALHSSCLQQRIYMYGDINRPDKQLESLEAYIQAVPAEAQTKWLLDMRTILVKEIQDKQASAKKP